MIYYTSNSNSSLRLQGKLPRTSKHPVPDGPTPDFPFPILEASLISRPAEEHPLSTPALDAQIIHLHLHPLQLQPSFPPSSAFFLTCTLAVALGLSPQLSANTALAQVTKDFLTAKSKRPTSVPDL